MVGFEPALTSEKLHLTSQSDAYWRSQDSPVNPGFD